MTDMKNAGDLGPKPKFAWTAIDDLYIDKSYQRSVDGRASKDMIKEIAATFRWELCPPITVSPRAKGGFTVIDGQHRLQAALHRGDIRAMPCWIVPANGREEEAGHFVEINQNRVRMHTVDLFHAAVVAGKPTEAGMQALLKKAGIAICKTAMTSDDVPPGQTQAVGAIRQVYRKYDEAVVVAALKFLRTTYSDMPGMLRSALIKSIVRLFAINARNEIPIDEQRLARVFDELPPDTLESMARETKGLFAGSTERGMVSAIVKQYNKGIRSGAKQLVEG